MTKEQLKKKKRELEKQSQDISKRLFKFRFEDQEREWWKHQLTRITKELIELQAQIERSA